MQNKSQYLKIWTTADVSKRAKAAMIYANYWIEVLEIYCQHLRKKSTWTK